MSIDFKNTIIKKHIMEGNFGLEKESLRITPEGNLSHTKHPFTGNPNMERDFCENQTELITDVFHSVDAVWDEIAKLHYDAVDQLLKLDTGKEYLWPFSNPPYVKGENDIPIAKYSGELKQKEIYREYLASKYGKKKMLFSGIHFNFSFPDVILEEGWKNSEFETLKEYKNYIYLDLAKKVTSYTWLIVYLTAASPLMDGSFFQDDAIGRSVARDYGSARCSEIGYWNEFVPLLDYTNLDTYISSIEKYIEEGSLKEISELYYPVRLKPKGANSLEALKEKGVNHIELRMIDLNPLSPVGIKKEDLYFLHLFIVYLLSLKDSNFEYYEQLMAIRNEKNAAKYESRGMWIEVGWNQSIPIRDIAFDILFDMELFFCKLGLEDAIECIRYQLQKVIHTEKRYVVQIKKQFGEQYVEKGLELIKNYAEGS